MAVDYEFGPSIKMKVKKIKHGEIIETYDQVAAEIPFTININDKEIATLLCTPDNLEELVYGFLYSSRMLVRFEDIKDLYIDKVKWVAHIEMDKAPDLSIMEKRLYTSGCGKGVMYASVQEIAMRSPLVSDVKIRASQIAELSKWLNHSSDLFKDTGGVHSAALSHLGDLPVISIDDVGRHNAVDKVIGYAIMNKFNLSEHILISSGRTSSEILYKARVCNIAVNISRGAPTHQAILKARDMAVTLVGFARGSNFTVYTHDDRIDFEN